MEKSLKHSNYEVLDNPDILVEIADWESVQTRAAHMQEAAAAYYDCLQHQMK